MTGFTVIGGYLGAGKTTLLNKLLAGDHGIRFALLINDFGKINIDANLIESESDSQINLTNGCVCCSLTDGFVEAIDNLLAMTPQPEHIVVEASGVADVANLAQYGYAPELQLDGILVLADAETVVEKANDKYVANTVRRQLKAADIIVLNKTDLLSDDQLEQRRNWITELVPDSTLIESTYADVPLSLLLGVHKEENTTEHDHVDHENYATWSFESDRPCNVQGLQNFIDALPASVIRAKGIAVLDDNTRQIIQVVGQRKSTDTIESNQQTTQIIAIGLARDFPSENLDSLAEKYLR